MATYIKVRANFKTMLASESVVTGTVEFTPAVAVAAGGTVFAPARVTGHLVAGGVLADSPYADSVNTGVSLVSLPGGVLYTAVAYLRAADGTGIPAITWHLNAISGRDINLADVPLPGNEKPAPLQPTPQPAPQPATPGRRTTFRVDDAGNGLARLVEIEEN